MELTKIRLTEEKETLLVPLLSKALEGKREKPILIDKKAEEILSKIEYDFTALRIPKQTMITLAMRAKKLDSYVIEYLGTHSYPVVIHLGCGLDNRIERVNFKKGIWYDLDYPEVIELRKEFFTENENYKMIGSSVTDYSWIESIKGDGEACIIAEGLFMYLDEDEIKELILKSMHKFPGSLVAFDAYSRITAKNVNNHPSIRKTGAKVKWGIDDARMIEKWGPGIKVLEEWYFTDSKDIANLLKADRFLFNIMGLFNAAKRAHRILCLSLGKP